MSRRAQRSKLCPTPSKTGFFTEDEAAAQGARVEGLIVQSHRPLRPFYVYRCDCLRFHLTHHSMGADGRFLRKANP